MFSGPWPPTDHLGTFMASEPGVKARWCSDTGPSALPISPSRAHDGVAGFLPGPPGGHHDRNNLQAAAPDHEWHSAANAPSAPAAAETESSPVEHSVARYAGAVARLSVGFVFLWAFFDKAFALGYSTGKDPTTGVIDRFGSAAWIHGGSPTTGYLSGVAGPFKGIFEPLSGAVWADYLFMIGLLAIGVALMLGIVLRVAAGSGALLLIFMWMASLPLANNPFMDDHLVYAIVLIGLAAFHAGDTLGLGRTWARTDLVRHYPVLR